MLRRFVLASLVLAAGPLADPTIAQVPTIVPGFPNVAQTPGAILSGLNAPGQGRTAIIAYHNGILYTLPELPSSQPGSDFQVRTWDLSDPTAPVETAQLGVSPMPINAHGYFKSGDYLIAGANWPPEAPWSFRYDTPGSNVRTEYPDLLCAGTRGCLFGPFFVGQTWWSYGEIEGTATFQRDWVESANWDHLGDTGVIGHPFLLGDLLIFASDQSRTGVATYDVSDSSNPVLLDVLTTGGAGGYWPDLWSGDGKLYIVFPYRTGGNGMRVVDATDPSDLQFVADVPLPGDESMYVQFQDEYAFLGSHKVDMRTFESVLDLDGANTTRPSDGGTGINTSQFLLPIGNLLVTGGIGPNQGMAIWAHQATPDTRGPTVTYHRPLAGQSSYPVDAPLSFLIHETLETPTIVNGTTFVVRPIDGPNAGQAVVGELTFAFNDILTFAPDADLESDRTYEVVFPAGGIRDAANNGMVGYSFTFSTGSTVGGNAPPVVTALTASAYPVTPGQNLTLNATANDPDAARGAAAALDYRFDFGDGS
ncbi:MAG: Ig-like domain-containing protein, partial [Acidobacteriota bacterium]